MSHQLPDVQTMDVEACVREMLMHLRMWNAGNLRKMALPKREKENKEDSKRYSDQFIEEQLEVGTPEDFVARSDIVKSFKRWNSEAGHKEVKMQWVYNALNAAYGHKKKGKVVEGQKKQGWNGVKFKLVNEAQKS
jgi:hypothetical protein